MRRSPRSPNSKVSRSIRGRKTATARTRRSSNTGRPPNRCRRPSRAIRPKELKIVSPQEFTNHLKAVNDEVRKAFEDSGTKVPDAFFCGFENYKTTLARGSATGILAIRTRGHQKPDAGLGASPVPPNSRISIARSLPEEDGREYKPQDTEVARPLPLEITFSGPEKAVREFALRDPQTEGPICRHPLHPCDQLRRKTRRVPPMPSSTSRRQPTLPLRPTSLAAASSCRRGTQGR